MDNQNIDKHIIEELKKSPLYNLSLSSKELFHSNFLAWIGNAYPKLFVEILKGLGCKADWSNDSWEIKREFLNFDLCIVKDNKIVFVLENKVKSIPKLTQLKGYNSKVDEYNGKAPYAEKVLLSLATDFPDMDEIEGSDWKIIHYSDLERELRSFIDEFPNDYLKKLVTDYCDFIGNLHCLVNESELWKVSPESKYLYDNETQIYRDSLDTIRLKNFYDKIRFARLLTLLEESLKVDNIHNLKNISGASIDDIARINEENNRPLYNPLENIFINWGYTNGGLLEAKVKVNQDFVLLVQVQGNQYRHGIEWITKKTNKQDVFWEISLKEKIVEKLGQAKGMSFFDFEIHENEKAFEKSNSRLDYNHFGVPFLYKYKKITTKATVNDVIEEITKDIHNIIKTAVSLKSV